MHLPQRCVVIRVEYKVEKVPLYRSSSQQSNKEHDDAAPTVLYTRDSADRRSGAVIPTDVKIYKPILK